ncbi:putative capsid protein [Sinorhizobium phage HMSP1-Susan]|nr:putative capsid protein [Sinorhizobium phage HMSP1-Susan]
MFQMMDAQQAFSFAQQQAYTINAQVYETKYPDYNYSEFVTVDTSSPAWSAGVITYISEMSGRADWQSGFAKDIPLAETSMGETLKTFEMAAIGYQWNIEELNRANFQNIPLTTRKAAAARKAYEQFMYNITLGNTAKGQEKGYHGLLNQPGVIAGNFPADGTAGSILWTAKTPAQIVRDINSLLTGIYTSTAEIELADTLVLPVELYLYLAQTPYSDNTMDTILSFVQKTNVYTLITGRPLMIRAARAARSAGAGGTGRVMAYKNDPTVVKLHLPLPFQFLPVYQDGPLNFVIPGIFRTGGIEVLAPAAMRYGDGALAAA